MIALADVKQLAGVLLVSMVLLSEAALAKSKPVRCLSLRNSEVSHRENPATFSIPRSDERRNLQEGDTVKMIFEPCKPDESAERMWVIVLKKLPKGYVGELDNVPATIENLDVGDKFEFGPEHVISIQSRKGEDDSPEGKTAMASPEIMNAGALPLFARRVLAVKKGDSGWRVFASRGPEREDSLIEVSADALIDKFFPLDSILYERGTTSWTWNEAELEYQPVSNNP